MPGTLDEIAAVPDLLGRIVGELDDRSRRHVQQLPEPDAAADVEREAYLVSTGVACHCGQRLHERMEIGDIR